MAKKSNLVESILGVAAVIGLATISAVCGVDGSTTTQCSNNIMRTTTPKSASYYDYKEGPYAKVRKMIENAEKVRTNASFNTKRVGNSVVVNMFDGNYTYTYRSNGDINDIRLPSGEIIVFNYDYYNRVSAVKSTDGGNMKFEYDEYGRLSYETDGHFWRRYQYHYRYDVITRESCSDGSTIDYEYDYNGNLKNVCRR